jgi:hypothetical protein
MACTLFRMTPVEALAGVTRNAARALGLADRGISPIGKRADLASVGHRPPPNSPIIWATILSPAPSAAASSVATADGRPNPDIRSIEMIKVGDKLPKAPFPNSSKSKATAARSAQYVQGRGSHQGQESRDLRPARRVHADLLAKHVPSTCENYDKLKAAGVDDIIASRSTMHS